MNLVWLDSFHSMTFKTVSSVRNNKINHYILISHFMRLDKKIINTSS